jgi:uncharacterized protein YegP (UPF0339 family)
MPKFTVYTDKNDKFRWKFIASTKRVVARSGKAYGRKEECLQSLGLLQKEISGAPVKHRVGKTGARKPGVQAASPRPPVAPRQAAPANPSRTPPTSR